MSYEGPGQPTGGREQDIGLIPDRERVVTPVVDYPLSEKISSIDPSRLALFGNSLGVISTRWPPPSSPASQPSCSTTACIPRTMRTAASCPRSKLQEDPEADSTAKGDILQGHWCMKTH